LTARFSGSFNSFFILINVSLGDIPFSAHKTHYKLSKYPFFFYLIEEIRLIQPLRKFEKSELLQKSVH